MEQHQDQSLDTVITSSRLDQMFELYKITAHVNSLSIIPIDPKRPPKIRHSFFNSLMTHSVLRHVIKMMCKKSVRSIILFQCCFGQFLFHLCQLAATVCLDATLPVVSSRGPSNHTEMLVLVCFQEISFLVRRQPKLTTKLYEKDMLWEFN